MPRYQTPQRLISRKGLSTDLSFNNGEAIDISSGDHTITSSFTAAIYIGGSGSLKVKMLEGTDLTLLRVVSGTFLPLCVTKIYQTGTTATDLVAFW